MIPFVCYADTTLSWVPAWGGPEMAAVMTACALMWGVQHLVFGASRVHGPWGLWALRGCVLAILGVILLGPTIVDQQPGAVERASMIYLVDGSQSMSLGAETPRWREGLEFLAAAERSAGDDYAGDTQGFRFGHRLEPLVTDRASPVVGGSTGSASTLDGLIAPPGATDSRLGEALRQLLPRVRESSTAGVVLVSDGRVRASESVEQLAKHFADARVPLHVVPVGEASGIGDIAVVSLVVPPRVRKYTENEVQVFLRSYGFTGQRTTVRLERQTGQVGEPGATLASEPVTLSGGAQSVSLVLRVNEQPEELVVVVDPIEGELTDRNNRVNTRVEIDRTKIRILYIENSLSAASLVLPAQLGVSMSRLFAGSVSATPVTVETALEADEDLECIVLVTNGTSPPREVVATNSTGWGGFPRTRAELFAYDCVIFSNVGPDVLEPAHHEWLAQWISGRGGGLVVAGGNALSDAAWRDSPLLSLLPVHLTQAAAVPPRPADVEVTVPSHPIWQMRLDQRANEQLLDQIPPLEVSPAARAAKATADVLAVQDAGAAPIIVAHRAGRGRVLVSTASLGGKALSNLADAWGAQPERVATKLWRNIVYWTTEGSSTGRRRLVAEPDKQFYRPGEPFSIFATAFDEAALRTEEYRILAMFEPASLDDVTTYSPVLWPDNMLRESGEVSPRIAWGEELPLQRNPDGQGYLLDLMLSQSGTAGDSGLRIELTAYEGDDSDAMYGQGTQVDSTSLSVQILSDPFEQQNPLPNHELLERVASVSGGQMLGHPEALADLLRQRPLSYGPPRYTSVPAWSHLGLWIGLLGLLTAEWIWRRAIGLA